MFYFLIMENMIKKLKNLFFNWFYFEIKQKQKLKNKQQYILLE